ncbi:MAG TPA: TetR/AcrR family transcriptional regulator [Bacteroidales bacterium]|jgi:AcrR family transcriptional regulator|nr:TetR/AcrR family transcriptional regulator [Bacteroidales bacterium]
MSDSDRQTEEKIFDAATEVFTEKGLDGARMQDIADQAGINKSLLHYYYRTKDRLFNAVFEKIASNMFSKFAPVFDENLSLEDKIRFFYREHISFLQRNPKLPAFLLNEINRNPARLRKIIDTLEIQKFWDILYAQNGKELEKYNITREKMPQIMTTIAAISVFPFAARGIFESLFKKIGIDFDTYLEERKEFAADFVIKGLTNKS